MFKKFLKPWTCQNAPTSTINMSTVVVVENISFKKNSSQELFGSGHTLYQKADVMGPTQGEERRAEKEVEGVDLCAPFRTQIDG